ncbi:MAG: hypothetical protein AMS18_00385 [Gemmatimonas sp. SG8_17]|nr:MAG: hypothetical protein AMS18_00385 [Gemmatimonas sp. SG8_17]
MRWLLSLAALLCLATPAMGQWTGPICENGLPCLSGYTGRVAHSASHAVLAVGVSEGLRLFDKDWNWQDRYLLGTIAMPILWETFDYIQWHVVPEGGFKSPPSRHAVYDIWSYQGAWILPLIREKKYWQAALVFVAWGGSIAIWELKR